MAQAALLRFGKITVQEPIMISTPKGSMGEVRFSGHRPASRCVLPRDSNTIHRLLKMDPAYWLPGRINVMGQTLTFIYSDLLSPALPSGPRMVFRHVSLHWINSIPSLQMTQYKERSL